MNKRKNPNMILWFESFGFALIILLSWVNEIFDLAGKLFGGGTSSNWREATFETLVVLGVWAMSFMMTRNLLDRLYYVENFLKVCAWCRKIGNGDEWLSIENYFAKGFETRTSHGICPGCAEKMMPPDEDTRKDRPEKTDRGR